MASVVVKVSRQAGAIRTGNQVQVQGRFRCRCRLGRWSNLQVVMQSVVCIHASSGFLTILLGVGLLRPLLWVCGPSIGDTTLHEAVVGKMYARQPVRSKFLVKRKTVACSPEYVRIQKKVEERWNSHH
jgi:hypothetical protein